MEKELSDLLQDEEFIKLAKNPRGKKIKFPRSSLTYCVEYEGEKYVVKKAGNNKISRFWNDIKRMYYGFQNDFFFGGFRKGLPALDDMAQEAKNHDNIEDYNFDQSEVRMKIKTPPAAFSREEGLLIREYVEGNSFRDMYNNLKMKGTGNFDSDMREIIFNSAREMYKILGVIPFDAHIKDVAISGTPRIFGSHFEVSWPTIQGEFQEEACNRTKAKSLLKFIYSVYKETKDYSLTVHAAKCVNSLYSPKENRGVKLAFTTFFNEYEETTWRRFVPKPIKTYFTSRMFNRKLDEQIKCTLSVTYNKENGNGNGRK